MYKAFISNTSGFCDAGSFVLEGERRIFGHLQHRWIADLVSHPTVMDAVRSLIGPNVLAWVSEFNTKAPKTPHFFSWHQDLFYWRHQYPDVAAIPMVTVWLALSPATLKSGRMRVIPASHDRLLAHQSKNCPHNLLTRAQEICVEVNEAEAVPVELSPGEFSIHHPLLHHASGPNTSDYPRVAIVTRYMAPEVIPPVRPAYAWLVSGEDRDNNWDHVAPINSQYGMALGKKSALSVQRVTGSRFK